MNRGFSMSGRPREPGENLACKVPRAIGAAQTQNIDDYWQKPPCVYIYIYVYIEPGRFGCGYTARPAGGVEWTLVSYGDGVHVSSAFPGIGVTRHRGHDLYREGCVVRPPRNVSTVFPLATTSIYIYRKPHRGSTVSLASKVLSVWAGSTPDPAMNIGKLVLRKPDDRAPADTSTLPKALDAMNSPGKARRHSHLSCFSWSKVQPQVIA